MSRSRHLKSICKINRVKAYIFLVVVGFLVFSCKDNNSVIDTAIQIVDNDYVLTINTKSLQFEFVSTKVLDTVPKAAISGLFLDGNPVVSTRVENNENPQTKLFAVTSSKGDKALVTIHFEEGIAKFTILPENEKSTIISLRLGGMPLAHGLGDAGAFRESFNLLENEDNTYQIQNDGGGQRWASSFAIFPQNSLAGVFFNKGKKEVTIDNDKYSMDITKEGKATFFYFLGDNKTIYENYKKLRNQEGYKDVKPKSRLFELGWESWDALGWNTNQVTVQEILQYFLDNEYPIKWAVTGSGFWEKGGTTTSFGKWGEKFSTPMILKNWMYGNDIKWMIGLRTNFIPEGGPYYPKTKERDKNLKVNSFYGNFLTSEARQKGFLVTDGGGEIMKITSPIFPIVPTNLLNGNVAGASEWYHGQYAKWEIDGIKEDTMMDLDSLTGIFNGPVTRIAEKGGLVMARNGEFTALGTLLRINDTHVGDMVKRIPITYLQYAASGFPNVYSDVAGAHNMHNLKEIEKNIRHTWLLSLTAGLAVGAYPKNWPKEKEAVFKKAIDFHYNLAPYMYSASIEGYESGYPSTLTPLTISFPNDNKVSELKNFQWMIGESILATPLLKNHHSGKMDVYLPKGIWYDFESSEKYEGPKVLRDFAIPIDKIPCFIGGKGIVLLRNSKSGQLSIKIYPVVNTTSAKFFGQDGKKQSSIVIADPDWSNLKIIDETLNRSVDFKLAQNSFEFDFIEGHNYSIK